MSQASKLTVIGDRESDIYELFATLPDVNTHLLVRSHTDRLTASGEKLSHCLAKQPWQGNKIVRVSANDYRTGRSAILQLRWTQVILPQPAKRKSLLKSYAQQTRVWVVELMETPDSVPEDEEPIHWRLLTTHRIESLEKALQITEWYVLRWLIEELSPEF